MEMLLQIFWIVLGIGLLWFGAGWLVQSSSDLARRLRLSEAVIGGTVVALGTSMPELISTAMAAINGNAGIAYGNIVGSNICNIMLILGLAAFSRKYRNPMRPSVSILVHDGIWMVVAIAVLGLFLGINLGLGADDASNVMVNGQPAFAVLTGMEGWVLLGLYVCFLTTTVIRAKRGRTPVADAVALTEEQAALSVGHLEAAAAHAGGAQPAVVKPTRSAWMDAGLLVVSLVLLSVGADRLVEGASNIAVKLGIPELVIGLTVVAVGTSLPELATSLIAGKKDKDDISVANVTGSNVQNILVCLGLAMVLVPSGVIGVDGAGATRDFWLMVLATGALIVSLLVFKRLGKIWGGLMLFGYLGYLGFLVMDAMKA